MSKSSIAEKLRALRNITIENGATEAEALNAANAYVRLRDKYQLDASEIDLRAEGTCQVDIDCSGGNSYVIAKSFLVGIAKFCKVKVWVSERARSCHIIGLRSDAEFAEWLIISLIGFVQREALGWALATTEPIYKSSIEDFAISAAMRVHQRLAGDASSHNAIVPVRDAMVQEAFDEMARQSGGRWGQSRKIGLSGHGEAIQAGNAAGSRASFAKPTGYERTLRIGAK